MVERLCGETWLKDWVERLGGGTRECIDVSIIQEDNLVALLKGAG